MRSSRVVLFPSKIKSKQNKKNFEIGIVFLFFHLLDIDCVSDFVCYKEREGIHERNFKNENKMKQGKEKRIVFLEKEKK
jgi:hypothetical protein